MKRRTKIILSLLIPRLLISLLVPPAVGGFLYRIYPHGGTLQYAFEPGLGGAISEAPLYIIITFIYGGLQTVGYTACMEILGWRWLRKRNMPKRPYYMLVGSLFGGIVGLSVSFRIRETYLPAFVIGLIVGVIVTSIKMKLHLLQKSKGPSTPP